MFSNQPLGESEKAVIDLLIDRGSQTAGTLDYHAVMKLYRFLFHLLFTCIVLFFINMLFYKTVEEETICNVLTIYIKKNKIFSLDILSHFLTILQRLYI